MAVIQVLLASLCLCWQVRSSPGSNPIWPQPAITEIGEEVMWVDRALTATFHCGSFDYPETLFTAQSPGTISYYADSLQEKVLEGSHIVKRLLKGESGSPPEASGKAMIPEQDIVRSAVRQSLIDLHGSTFVPWKFHKRRSRFEPDANHQHDRLVSLTINQLVCPLSKTEPSHFHDGEEAYKVIMRNGTAIIEAPSTIGTLRALETLKQLFYAHSSGSGVYTPYAPFWIRDSPRFSHRGLSLDIARNPFTIDDAMRTIDAMATTKMNRLHLHATDSQSWPLEIPSLPELAAEGAYQPDLVWTVDDLEAVQSYGDYRGVMVYVELDMPGHTASVAQGYPELIAAYNELDWSTFAAEPLSGQLKLNSSRVKDFLDTLFADLLPRLRTHSAMYHLGGDEVNRKVHLLDETVMSDDVDALKPLIQQVFDQIFEHVISQGMRPIVWEEMVLDWDLELPPKFRRTLVQVWRSTEHIEQVLRKGHPVIFGDCHHWYLDCGFGQFLDPYESGRSPPGVPFNSSGGRGSQLEPPYLDYCNPFHNWRDIYAFNPLANVSAELHSLVEGGEVLMWSEQTDSSDLDYKLWPRAAAAAEVLWNGPASPHPLTTWRLGHWRERLVVDRGIGASPVTMTWCLMEGRCEY